MKSQRERINFERKAFPIPAEYRPMYMISLIMLILYKVCNGGKSELLRLHLFAWALKNGQNQDILKNHILSEFRNSLSVWGIEPNLNRALIFANAEGYVSVEKNNYVLTQKGKGFTKSIMEDPELFDREKKFLEFVGKRTITQSRLDKIVKRWENTNALR